MLDNFLNNQEEWHVIKHDEGDDDGKNNRIIITVEAYVGLEKKKTYDPGNDIIFKTLANILSVNKNIQSLGVKLDNLETNTIIIVKNFNFLEEFMEYEICLKAIKSCLDYYEKYDLKILKYKNLQLMESVNEKTNIKQLLKDRRDNKKCEDVCYSKRVEYLRKKKVK